MAVKGYDVVAYFTENKALKGSADFTSTHDGAFYHFASAENKTLFDATPQKYVPQYGGWCAYAVSLNKKVGIDPEAFYINNGKLYLNYNAKTQKRWLENKDDLIQAADEIWPELKHN